MRWVCCWWTLLTPAQTIHDRIILIPVKTAFFWTDFNVSNRFLSNETRHLSSVSASYTDVTFTAQVNCKRALFYSDVVHSFTQVCWRQHNATLLHSKCFWMGICSLSHKMESRGSLGIWKGHIWGPPLWMFTFKDKWSHWVHVSCEWAPSAYMGFLNAHQNNLSKPGDAFLRRLMWGQIGNHFNKIPLGWNCISQKTKRWPGRGETRGTPTVEGLPEVLRTI